jgi:hypothetical protein
VAVNSEEAEQQVCQDFADIKSHGAVVGKLGINHVCGLICRQQRRGGGFTQGDISRKGGQRGNWAGLAGWQAGRKAGRQGLQTTWAATRASHFKAFHTCGHDGSGVQVSMQ